MFETCALISLVFLHSHAFLGMLQFNVFLLVNCLGLRGNGVAVISLKYCA